MEITAESISPGNDKLADAAFMTDIFSLVHIAFGTTVEEIADMPGLSPSIRNAILEESGELGLTGACQGAE
jgi:c-di-GMP-related signal transduction protein